ncbi:MAG: hypothetical protein NZ651_00140 [Candidatus Bipolaricaulota bacterium]|nr:hypothetical protein [Candidatus Bipolaricaulota bacterium]MDW8126180.1 hypothetical protein [Candidatus Bipolaricaulota bacterium]
MARRWLLFMMACALGFPGLAGSVSRTATVSLSIPALSVLSLPGRGLSGREIELEIRPDELVQGVLLVPLEVKSNVPWAVTARVLAEARADPVVGVQGGPEVLVGTEEIPLLSGRSGKHELTLVVKLANLGQAQDKVRLMLKIAGMGQ